MSEIFFKIILSAVILGYLIWRLVYSPKFTNLALQHFILDSLRKKEFQELNVHHSEKIRIRSRSAYAHWNVNKDMNTGDLIVAFDVHPSMFPVSISSSVFIHIRNEAHFAEIRKALEHSDDYSPFLATPEIMNRILQKKPEA